MADVDGEENRKPNIGSEKRRYVPFSMEEDAKSVAKQENRESTD
ncbi:hypothetical protein SS1G_07747 [Sclerotinia sclerotiorum 1980 UF-70]|uniref:Uncharacterized protein n=1 Tax=Sclerotinia sclerotiorum (strain ATCC 18683 / 1980 / Ss-1) TaxID=665079 RepID=A7EQZ4_SCLS1|nr:hypothetical protein SS1G_07747 [Sclerotinia sclerotiorum 1980 UF-70]EDN91886.1 hypothetical protein SS1G_07747 [Sclerotinia sclerotiorum 1980 UF-70]